MQNGPLHLLDLAVMWPPEFQPFISGRLRALAEAGVKVAVVSSTNGRMEHDKLPFAQIIRAPHLRERRIVVAGRTLAATARAATINARLIPRLIRLARRRTGSLKAFAWWWAEAIPLLTVRPDVVHFEWNSLAAEYDWLPELFDVPFVVSCRGRQVNILPHLPGGENLAVKLAGSFSRAALVHGVCKEILQEAVQLGLPPEKARVVYTCVDLEFFRPRPPAVPSAGPFRLINVGAGIWRKGLEYLLLSLRLLVDRGHDVVLEIADYDGPERDRANYTIADLGLTDRVTILGKISPAEVRDALWRADAFVLSALSEGISNAVIEAMACALPIVTTDCGGMREAVTDGIEGFVVPTRDPQAIANAVQRLCTDAHLRTAMGQSGRARAEKQFDSRVQASQFIAMYNEAISSPSQRGASERLRDSEALLRGQPEARQSNLNIVTVADLHWKNGHEYALQAISQLIAQGYPARYTIVGNGPFLEAVGFARYELGLMNMVDIETDVDRAEAILDSADLFLLAAIETGAQTGLESALRRGIPVVCTDVSDLAERAKSSLTTKIVPRRDFQAIVDAIRGLVRPTSPLSPLTAASHASGIMGGTTSAQA